MRARRRDMTKISDLSLTCSERAFRVYPTACALLALWSAPTNPTYLRYAATRLAYLEGRGLDVLERFRESEVRS